MQHVQERAGIFTPRRLQLFLRPPLANLSNDYQCIFTNSYDPTAKWLKCIFPLYNLRRVHEQHIFLILRVFHLFFLESDTWKGGSFNSNCSISVHFDNTKCACEISLALELVLSSLRIHFTDFSFEENIAALSCYCKAVPGTEWKAKRGLSQLSTALSSLFLYFSACSCIMSSCTG